MTNGGGAACECEPGWSGGLCDEPDVCAGGDHITVRPVLYVPTDGVLEDPEAALERFAAHSELAARYDTMQLIDLVFTVGQYNLVSMALNTLGVQRDEGFPGFPEG